MLSHIGRVRRSYRFRIHGAASRLFRTHWAASEGLPWQLASGGRRRKTEDDSGRNDGVCPVSTHQYRPTPRTRHAIRHVIIRLNAGTKLAKYVSLHFHLVGAQPHHRSRPARARAPSASRKNVVESQPSKVGDSSSNPELHPSTAASNVPCSRTDPLSEPTRTLASASRRRLAPTRPPRNASMCEHVSSTPGTTGPRTPSGLA